MNLEAITDRLCPGGAADAAPGQRPRRLHGPALRRQVGAALRAVRAAGLGAVPAAALRAAVPCPRRQRRLARRRLQRQVADADLSFLPCLLSVLVELLHGTS